MAVKHIVVHSYIGSDDVSWTSVEDGIAYICEAVKTHGTDEEYTEIIKRRDHLLTLNPTDELINATLIKRTFEFADEDAKNSAYATFSDSSMKLFSSILQDKIEFLDICINV